MKYRAEITQESVDAFTRREAFKKSNMKVVPTYGNTYMYLNNNIIAQMCDKGVVYITNAGWASNTTKARLNGLSGVSIHQKNFQWYLNDIPWDGEWTRVQ